MKPLLRFKTTFIATLLVLASTASFSQDYETNKTLNKSLDVPANVVIEMKNHSGDVRFVSTNDNKVTMTTEVHIDAKTKEDADLLLKAIENFDFELEGNRLMIDTRFYTNMNTINNKTTMVLLNKDKIHLKNFEISHEICIPKNASLELENKYSHLILPDLEGEAKINLYSGKMTASDFHSKVTLAAKYSRISAGNFMAASEIELYDTDIEFKTSADLEITSKYSKVEADKTGALTLESYDDDFYIDEMTSLKLNAKYSDLESKATLSTLSLELYDCNLSVKSARSMEFNGKYSKLKLGDVATVKIDDVYDSNLSFGKTEQIEIGKSKYSEFMIEANSNLSIVETYNDDIQIKSLNSGFSGISLDGKYTKLNVNADSVSCKVDVAMKYGKVDLPSSIQTIKHIEKNSELEVQAGTSGGLITVRGYDNTVVIR